MVVSCCGCSCGVQVHHPPDPDSFAWRGAARFLRDESVRGTLAESTVTRAEYLEWGHARCNDKFSSRW